MLIQRSVETINTTKLLTFNRQREKPSNQVRRQRERGTPDSVWSCAVKPRYNFTSGPVSRRLRSCILMSLFARWDTHQSMLLLLLFFFFWCVCVCVLWRGLILDIFFLYNAVFASVLLAGHLPKGF